MLYYGILFFQQDSENVILMHRICSSHVQCIDHRRRGDILLNRMLRVWVHWVHYSRYPDPYTKLRLDHCKGARSGPIGRRTSILLRVNIKSASHLSLEVCNLHGRVPGSQPVGGGKPREAGLARWH